MASRDALTTATAAVESVAGLAGVEWDAVEGTDLVEATVAVARVKALAEAALVAVAERLEATGASDELGWASAKDFLTHVTGGRKGAGSTYVRVARQTADLPEVRSAMAAGEVSLAQASVIGGRVATLPHAPELREAVAGKMLDRVAAQSADATDLDRGFPAVVRELDPDGTLLRADLDKDNADRGAHHARFLSFTPDTLGGVRIKGYGSL
ncbi:MAG TPA: DUF222 domain-containing protein, partial [Nocardioides sp.]|nr:DUF222 domain-containing protein [Nocardioides sp.]